MAWFSKDTLALLVYSMFLHVFFPHSGLRNFQWTLPAVHWFFQILFCWLWWCLRQVVIFLYC